MYHVCFCICSNCNDKKDDKDGMKQTFTEIIRLYWNNQTVNLILKKQ